MELIGRRRFSIGVSLATISYLVPTWSARGRSRRAADLIIDRIQWSDDYGSSWHKNPVVPDSEVWFEARVRNAGSAGTPRRNRISVEFRVNGVLVAWTGGHVGGLSVSESVVLRANGSTDGNNFWSPTGVGNHTVEASATIISSERNKNNNSLSATITVESSNLVANDDSASTLQNTSTNIPVLANDSAPAGKNLVIKFVQSPTDQGGTAVIAADGKSVVYTPPSGFVGQDSFSYEVMAA
jgi:hypothetical protein